MDLLAAFHLYVLFVVTFSCIIYTKGRQTNKGPGPTGGLVNYL